MDDPADPGESHPFALLQRGHQRFPFGQLARMERLVRIGAITQRVGLGEAQQRSDYGSRIGSDHVDRIIGLVA